MSSIRYGTGCLVLELDFWQATKAMDISVFRVLISGGGGDGCRGACGEPYEVLFYSAAEVREVIRELEAMANVIETKMKLQEERIQADLAKLRGE